MFISFSSFLGHVSLSLILILEGGRGEFPLKYKCTEINMDNLQKIWIELVEYSYGNRNINHIFVVLETFELYLKEMSNKDRLKYESINIKMLSTVKFELDSLVKNKNTPDRDKLLRKRDKLFGNLLRNVTIENDKFKTTKVFNNFVKGITFFSSEEVYDKGQPVYHRKGSCPKRGEPNNKCESTNSNTTKLQKENEIRKCFIERLVYDELWAKIAMSSQDISHLQWLEDTRQAYQSCHKDSVIGIDIEYNENNIPVQLKVFENNNQDIYTKKWDTSINDYIYPVDCLLYKDDGTMIRKISFPDD